MPKFDYDGFMQQMGGHPARAMAQQLLGCTWGRGIATPDDMAPCEAGAVQIVILHPPDGSEAAVAELRLCAKHIERLQQETEPHKGET